MKFDGKLHGQVRLGPYRRTCHARQRGGVGSGTTAAGRVAARPDPAPPGGDDDEAPAAAGNHLALVWDDGGPSLVALRPPISPGKARAVHHYARLAAEARSARAD